MVLIAEEGTLQIRLPDYGPPLFGPSDRQLKFHESSL